MKKQENGANPIENGYSAWLRYRQLTDQAVIGSYAEYGKAIIIGSDHPTVRTAAEELQRGLNALLGITVPLASQQSLASQQLQQTRSEEGTSASRVGSEAVSGVEFSAIADAVSDVESSAISAVGSDAAFSGAESSSGDGYIVIGLFQEDPAFAERYFGENIVDDVGLDGFAIIRNSGKRNIAIGAFSPAGALYGAFHMLRLVAQGKTISDVKDIQAPANGLRMLNHWDNFDGSIERGYAGRSFFYDGNAFLNDGERLRDYARLMASIGINSICINNVNVHHEESYFITPRYLPEVAKIASVFRLYGIQLYLSVNYAAPMELGELDTADPLHPATADWWKRQASTVYEQIPDLGGFVVKADSENRPGPFTYGRDHADGANMLAAALEPYDGIVIWRCFVYNCKQDWRDRKTDRARAAYDHFRPLDGRFADNVVLQIKNGPLDFQVREPVSPLFGAMANTNQVLELQITQEYTGQQRHLCYLIPQWKEILDFDTHARNAPSPIKRIADGSVWGNAVSGIAAVTNTGNDANWTGHLLAQANLYGYGRLIWDTELSSEEIAKEWIALTFGDHEAVSSVVSRILLDSWRIYESYTAPLGIGWMVNPDHHYGPNVDGYEYAKWGTYHYADHEGIGVDRTVASGTGYTAQYIGGNADLYESLEHCPDELLLFFHHVPYRHVLKSGKTVIQHIYDSRFEGAQEAAGLLEQWQTLKPHIEDGLYRQVETRLADQAEHAKEWRDQINTYFNRKSGIPDVHGRTIY